MAPGAEQLCPAKCARNKTLAPQIHAAERRCEQGGDDSEVCRSQKPPAFHTSIFASHETGIISSQPAYISIREYFDKVDDERFIEASGLLETDAEKLAPAEHEELLAVFAYWHRERNRERANT